MDGYAWLHRGAVSCAQALCLGSSEKVLGHVRYVVRRTGTLVGRFGLRVLLVFDGADLPGKEGTELARAESRATARSRALELLQEGRRQEAQKAFLGAVDIGPEDASLCIQALQGVSGVECIVAPYEADAQLAWLARTGRAEIIITEDSDLIVHGCPRVWTKLDIATGEAIQFRPRRVLEHLGLKDREELLEAAMLAGCDYIPRPITGVGIHTAVKLVRKYGVGGYPGFDVTRMDQSGEVQIEREPEEELPETARELSRFTAPSRLQKGVPSTAEPKTGALQAVFRMARTRASWEVPHDFGLQMLCARLLFQHQTIYDPGTKTQQPLRPLPAELHRKLRIPSADGMDFGGQGEGEDDDEDARDHEYAFGYDPQFGSFSVLHPAAVESFAGGYDPDHWVKSFGDPRGSLVFLGPLLLHPPTVIGISEGRVSPEPPFRFFGLELSISEVRQLFVGILIQRSWTHFFYLSCLDLVWIPFSTERLSCEGLGSARHTRVCLPDPTPEDEEEATEQDIIVCLREGDPELLHFSPLGSSR